MVNLLQVDISKYDGLRESYNCLLEERDGATTVQQDTPVFSDAGLFAADTYDHAEGIVILIYGIL